MNFKLAVVALLLFAVVRAGVFDPNAGPIVVNGPPRPPFTTSTAVTTITTPVFSTTTVTPSISTSTMTTIPTTTATNSSSMSSNGTPTMTASTDTSISGAGKHHANTALVYGLVAIVVLAILE